MTQVGLLFSAREPAHLEVFRPFNWMDTLESDCCTVLTTKLTGRDQRIADGLEVAALNDAEDTYMAEASGQGIAVSFTSLRGVTVSLAHVGPSDRFKQYYNPQTGDTAVSGRKKRKLRVEGGVAPHSKPVTADYDSDDARIIELKQLGHSDDFVASKLVEEGRIRYVGKTIGSRYLRLRKVLEDKEDERLDDELSDWHEGEDDKLLSIAKSLQGKLDRQIETLTVRMWKEVSAFLAGKLGGKKRYTHRACRQRAGAVHAGNALAPIEHDDDQEGRRKMREERIKKAKADRIAKAIEATSLEERRRAKTAERKRVMAEANQKKVQFELKKQVDKKERLRIREERNANRELAKQTRLRILNHMRIEREWEMEKNRREKEIYKDIMKVDLNGKASGRSGNKKNAYDSDEESEAIDDLESDEEEADYSDLDEAEDADDESETEPVIDPLLEDSMIGDEPIIDSVVGSPAPTPAVVKRPVPAVVKLPVATKAPVTNRPQRKRKSAEVKNSKEATELPSTPARKKPSTPKKRSPVKSAPAVEEDDTIAVTEPLSTPTSKQILSPKKRSPPKPSPAVDEGDYVAVTAENLFNPRSIMNREELDLLCFARGIPRRSDAEESRPELVARMHAADHELLRQELDDLLRQATEGVQGNKAAKIERLQKSDASKSIAGGMGLDSRDLDHMRRYEGFVGEFNYLLQEAEGLQHQPEGISAAGDSAYADW